MKQMIEALFTPAHAHALEALLDEPLAGTLDQATADGQPHVFQFVILNM
jgi:hypothetical protein